MINRNIIGLILILSGIALQLNCNSNNVSSLSNGNGIRHLNGTIENWIYGDTLNIMGISYIVDYGYPVLDETLYIYGSTTINEKGIFSIPLTDPPTERKNMLIGYWHMWGSRDNYETFTISDTLGGFESMKLNVFSNEPKRVLEWIDCSSRNLKFVNLTDYAVGDYICRYIFSDRPNNVAYKQHYYYGSGDSVLITEIGNLNLAKGWNKIVKKLSTKTRERYEFTERVDNGFIGRYYTRK